MTSSPPTALELCSSYELGQVLEVLREIAAEHRDGPGFPALRRASREGLLYFGRDPWNDDAWVARHFALRELLVEAHGDEATATQAALLIERLLAAKQQLEDSP